MIRPIIDDESHAKALRRIEQLWNARPGTPEQQELDALATLVDAYERRVVPIEAPTPIAAILARCEELGWTRIELEPLIGSRARVSEILSGKRSLTLAMIRRLHDAMGIPADVLISEPSPVPSPRRSSARRRMVPSSAKRRTSASRSKRNI
jgi:HTH-type transcriptional regulator / antitoxin HigA